METYIIKNMSNNREYSVYANKSSTFKMVARSEMCWFSDGVKVKITKEATGHSKVFTRENGEIKEI